MIETKTRNQNQLPWNKEHWQQIDMAFYAKCDRAKIP